MFSNRRPAGKSTSGPSRAWRIRPRQALSTSTCVGACPVTHTIGIESPEAEDGPVIMPVPGGPDVPTHTPMPPGRARV